MHQKRKNGSLHGAEAVRTIGFELGGIDGAQKAFGDGVLGKKFVYARRSNPTVQSCEARLAEIEGASWSVATASGMAAIDVALSVLDSRSDQPWVFPDDVYSGTRAYALDLLQRRRGVPVVLVPTCFGKERTEAFIKAIEMHRPSVVYFEPISNPLVSLVDGPEIVRAAKAVGAFVVVDNTFATSYLCRPLEWGSDVVIHSATKYLCGHNDTLAGVISGHDPRLRQQLLEHRSLIGSVLAPDEAARLHSYTRTFELRVRQQNRSAIVLASFLDSHAAVSQVRFPGLKACGDWETASKIFNGNGFGAIITFHIASGLDGCRAFMEMIDGRIAHIGTLGDVETSLLHIESGFQGGYATDAFRLSVGIEDPAEIINVLRPCLDMVCESSQHSIALSSNG